MTTHRRAPKLIDTQRVAELLNYANTANVYQLAKKDPDFPKPAGKYTHDTNGHTCHLYDEHDIIDYQKRREHRAIKTEHRENRGRQIDETLVADFLKRPSCNPFREIRKGPKPGQPLKKRSAP